MAFDPATGKFKPDDTAGVDAGVAPSVALGTGPAAVDAAPPSPGAADAGAPPDAAPAPAAPAPSDSPSFLDSALGVVKTTVNLAANPLLAPAIPAAKAVWSLLPDGTPAKPETPPAPVAPPTASAATEALTPPRPSFRRLPKSTLRPIRRRLRRSLSRKKSFKRTVMSLQPTSRARRRSSSRTMLG
jgi:hypothetical protein